MALLQGKAVSPSCSLGAGRPPLRAIRRAGVSRKPVVAVKVSREGSTSLGHYTQKHPLALSS